MAYASHQMSLSLVLCTKYKVMLSRLKLKNWTPFLKVALGSQGFVFCPKPTDAILRTDKTSGPQLLTTLDYFAAAGGRRYDEDCCWIAYLDVLSVRDHLHRQPEFSRIRA